MVYNISRLIPGTILVLVVSISYILKLDFYLLFSLCALIIYDLFYSKLLDYKFLILLLFISITFYFFRANLIIFFNNLVILEILIIVSIFVLKKYKQELFIISIYIFCLILFHLSSFDRNLVYITIFISFINDTIAYLVGKKIGGPLIVPNISPKKTWSGTSVSFFVSTIILYILEFSVFVCLTISILFFLGDIFFSFIKRFLKIKDFSNLLKGHGGILDRIDSIFFVIIFFQGSLIFI